MIQRYSKNIGHAHVAPAAVETFKAAQVVPASELNKTAAPEELCTSVLSKYVWFRRDLYFLAVPRKTARPRRCRASATPGSAKEDSSPTPLPGKRNSTGSVPTQLTGTPTMATRALAKVAGKRNSTGSSRVAQLKGARSVGKSPKGSPLIINRRIQQALGLKGTRTSSTQPRAHQWQWNPAGTGAVQQLREGQQRPDTRSPLPLRRRRK
eukprot:g71965.t1